jgi:hypothetical protein
MIYLTQCKNLYEYHSVLPPITTIKKKERKKHHQQGILGCQREHNGRSPAERLRGRL